MVEFLENILAFSLKQDLVYSHQSLAEERLLEPWSWLEGSYKIGSVCPSFRPSVLSVSKFSWDWLVRFFFFLVRVSLMLGVIYSCDGKLDFLEKIPIGQKWAKMAQKHGFWTF